MPSPAPQDFSEERAADEAAAWVLRCDRGLTPEEQDDFSHWLARDSRHREQWARHRRHWDRLAPLAQWRPEHSARPNPDLLAPAARPKRWVWLLAPLAAAASIVLFLSLWPAVTPEVGGPAPVASTVVREPASTRRILEDGSLVELNQGAVLHPEFSATARRVRLEHGEAHFTVTKDLARPFIVTAGGVDVWAVGTAFNVRFDTASLEVLVTEGRVRLSEVRPTAPAFHEPAASLPKPLVPALDAGQRVVVSLTGEAQQPRIATLTAGEIERVLAWQHRMLEFTSAPLAEIVAEFNRRNRVQLAVSDPELAAVRISASFRSDNVDGFVRLVELGFGVQAERRGASQIILRKAP
ncbi:MAG: FecR domain-containing protein [Opitutaceae bacterium]|nr:FecR domain-containing protein [Opitutaceae bacterium]